MKIYRITILVLVFLSIAANNSFAYDDEYTVKKEVMTTKDAESTFVIFSCNIWSGYKNSRDFNIRTKRKEKSDDIFRMCSCNEKNHNFLGTTSYECTCFDETPEELKNFQWRVFGGKLWTCNYFITYLYKDDYYFIDDRMEVPGSY